MTPVPPAGVTARPIPPRARRERKGLAAVAVLAVASTLAALSGGPARRPMRALPQAEPAVLRGYDGAHESDVFGSWIASGVDLDGDGFPEALVGAPEDDSRGTDRGRAAVFSGSSGGMLFEIFGDADGVFLGERVGFGPDVDGDGVADLLVRARGLGSTGDRVIVASGLDGRQIRQLTAGRDADELGTWLAALPDLDHDGVGDIAVGAPGRWDAPVAGRAHVFSGATGRLLRTLQGADRPHDRFGFSMAVVGDQDGDGVVDLAVSSLEATDGQPLVGAVRVFSLADGRQLSMLPGASARHHFGHELATLPDMDRDGRAELLVGAFLEDGHGYVRALDPLTGAVHREVRSGVRGDGFGHTVGVIGDVDGDGVTDWGVGAPNAVHPASGYTGVGRVDVWSGRTGERLASHWGHREGAHFGYAIAPAGDVDGDGRADALIASVVEGSAPGHARVIAPAKALPLSLSR